MRHLMAILGVLAMLVTLSAPVAALAMRVPCHDRAMATMTMTGDGMVACKPIAKTCAAPCLAMSNCQSHCGSIAPFVQVDRSDLALPQFAIVLRVAEDEQPPGVDSPVDGPPPRV